MVLPENDKVIKKILFSAGLRITRNRKVVLDLLISEAVPMAHMEIAQKLSVPIDRVTLYRTLETLTKTGIVHQVQGIDGVWRFCAHESKAGQCPGNHPHFLCTVCGRMICLSNQTLPHFAAPEGYEVEGKQLVLYGQCPKCRNK